MVPTLDIPLLNNDNLVPDLKINQIDEFDDERNLSDSVWRDDRGQFVTISKKIIQTAREKADREEIDGEELLKSLGARLLHLCCKLDAVECAGGLIDGDAGIHVPINKMDEYGRTPLQNAAEMNSVRCIELLLRKQARTDLRSKDEKSLLAIEIALASKRLQVVWTPNNPVEELLVLLGERHLRGIGMLVDGTKNVAEIAHTLAMEGRVVALAALLMAGAEIVNAAVVLQSEAGDGNQETSIYEHVVREAILLRQMGQTQSSGSGAKAGSESSREREMRRQLLLCEMELLQLFGAVARGSGTNRKQTSALIRSCQAGDEAVVQLLLKTDIDVNDADCDGNSALHWCLKGGSDSQESRLRIVCLLLNQEAQVSQKNMLGLTPVHVAAANGNSGALQVFLLQEPASVDAVSETKETPLFLAVKNESLECARLLMSFGANAHVLNLRRERPIDLAKSQDMRFILRRSNNNIWNHAREIKRGASSDSSAETSEVFLNPTGKDSCTLESSCLNTKTVLCRYFKSPSGCIKGARCHFAHTEAQLKGSMVGAGGAEERDRSLLHVFGSNLRKERLPDELTRKIFIGGLPPSVDSACLRQFFENQFGPVQSSTVIGSQSGDYVQSRGFGFITFQEPDSAIAAVQAHYVTILGKKVEIKDAVPKIPFLQIEVDDHGDKKQADDGRLASMSWAEKLLSSAQQDQGVTVVTGRSGEPCGIPPWVATFRRWLPAFLVDVSKRLKEGEWYPLSSLKGDFRATSGMELEHVSLGYPKLSDFMRSFPGICRMKIVPVGRGPATHMVLLPNLPRSHNLPAQKLPLFGNAEFRLNPKSSYEEQVANPASSRNHLLDIDKDDDWTLQNPLCFAAGGGDCTASAQSNMDRFLTFLDTNRSFFTPWSTPLEIAKVPKNDSQQSRWAVYNRIEEEHSSFSFFSRQFDYYENLRKNKVFEVASNEERSRTTCLLCKEKKALWVSMPCGHKVLCQACKCKHVSSGRCMRCRAIIHCLFFAPWDTSRVKAKAPDVPKDTNELDQNSSPFDSPLDNHQDSPISVVSAFGSSWTSSSSNSGDGNSSGKGISGGASSVFCTLCKERKAVWANIPCGHEVLCSACKSSQLKRSNTCLICNSAVRNLIPLYE